MASSSNKIDKIQKKNKFENETEENNNKGQKKKDINRRNRREIKRQKI